MMERTPPIRARGGAWCAPLLVSIALLVPLSRAGADPAPDSATVATGATTPLAAAAPDSGIAAASGVNPTLHSTRKVRLKGHSHNVARSGPGEGFSIVGVYESGTSFPVIAKRDDWYGVRLSNSETGWIHASLCQEFDDLSDLEFKPNPKLFSRTGSYILTGYGGAYAFDRKSNSLVLGGRLGYYVFDRVQVEGGVAWTHVRRPQEIVESLFDLSLEAEDFGMLFYHLIATYELMPGRQMVPFVSGGLGSSIMQGESEPSFNIGAGTTLFLSKRTAMRWEFRHYRFSSGSSNARIANNNIEFTIGTAVLF